MPTKKRIHTAVIMLSSNKKKIGKRSKVLHPVFKSQILGLRTTHLHSA
jgi:hypothetical protein